VRERERVIRDVILRKSGENTDFYFVF